MGAVAEVERRLGDGLWYPKGHPREVEQPPVVQSPRKVTDPTPVLSVVDLGILPVFLDSCWVDSPGFVLLSPVPLENVAKMIFPSSSNTRPHVCSL